MSVTDHGIVLLLVSNLQYLAALIVLNISVTIVATFA